MKSQSKFSYKPANLQPSSYKPRSQQNVIEYVVKSSKPKEPSLNSIETLEEKKTSSHSNNTFSRNNKAAIEYFAKSPKPKEPSSPSVKTFSRNDKSFINYIPKQSQQNKLLADRQETLEERIEGVKVAEISQYVAVDEAELSRAESETLSDSDAAARHGILFERHCRLYFQDVLNLKLLPRVVVSKENEKAYKEYVRKIQEKKFGTFRPNVLAEIDGHFIGPSSFKWAEVLKSIQIYPDDLNIGECRIFLEAKAAIFHDKSALHLIWQEIDRKKEQSKPKDSQNFSYKKSKSESKLKAFEDCNPFEANLKDKSIEELEKLLDKEKKKSLSKNK